MHRDPLLAAAQLTSDDLDSYGPYRYPNAQVRVLENKEDFLHLDPVPFSFLTKYYSTVTEYLL